MTCNEEVAYNFTARTAQHHMYQGNTEIPMCKSCPSQTRNAEDGSGYCIFKGLPMFSCAARIEIHCTSDNWNYIGCRNHMHMDLVMVNFEVPFHFGVFSSTLEKA